MATRWEKMKKEEKKENCCWNNNCFDIEFSKEVLDVSSSEPCSQQHHPFQKNNLYNFVVRWEQQKKTVFDAQRFSTEDQKKSQRKNYYAFCSCISLWISTFSTFLDRIFHIFFSSSSLLVWHVFHEFLREQTQNMSITLFCVQYFLRFFLFSFFIMQLTWHPLQCHHFFHAVCPINNWIVFSRFNFVSEVFHMELLQKSKKYQFNTSMEMVLQTSGVDNKFIYSLVHDLFCFFLLV